MYYINKFGLKKHLINSKYHNDEKSYVKSLYGKINYVLQIEKDNKEFKKYKLLVKRLLLDKE